MHDGHAGFVELAMELGGKLDCFCAVKIIVRGENIMDTTNQIPT